MYKRNVWLEACSALVIQDRFIVQPQSRLIYEPRWKNRRLAAAAFTHSYWWASRQIHEQLTFDKSYDFILHLHKDSLLNSPVIKNTQPSEVSLFCLGKQIKGR